MRSSTVAPSIGPKAQPTGYADADLGAVDGIRFGDGEDDAIGELLDLAAALPVGNDDRELVAAEAPDMPIGADLVAQALGDRLENGVALGVAERVVDRLEPVEVEEHDRAGHTAGGGRAQRFAQQLANPAAIGQAGQDVDIGEMGQPLLRLAHVRDVEPDAAEAFEAARRINDGIARQRNPAGAAAGLQLHLEVGEGLLVEQHASEFRMAAEESGQRMTKDLGGGTADQRSHSAGDVCDAILRIDLPQPADTALFIFLQQAARRFRTASPCRHWS
jgi:hypothetical protein